MTKQDIEQKLDVPIINMIRSMESCIHIAESVYGKGAAVQITDYDAQHILMVLYAIERGE